MTSEEIATGEEVAGCMFCEAVRAATLSQVRKKSNIDDKV